MKPNGQIGEMSYVDLSAIEFPQDYVVPRSGTIAGSYQAGFDLPQEVVALWREGHAHAVAGEFVASYYSAMGFGGAVEIEALRDDPDCIGGVIVTARSGFDYATYAVWEASGKIYVEQP